MIVRPWVRVAREVLLALGRDHRVSFNEGPADEGSRITLSVETADGKPMNSWQVHPGAARRIQTMINDRGIAI